MILGLLLINSLNVFAQAQTQAQGQPATTSKQTLSSVEFEKNKPTRVPPFVNNKSYPIEVETELKKYLDQEKYDDFYNLIIKTPISKENYIRYFEGIKNEGHIPLYWLMAEYYASQNDENNTMRWLYTALILSEQDSNICNNSSNAVYYLLKNHPKAEEISRKNPQKNSIILKEVYKFIVSLRIRSHPKWACVYGKDMGTSVRDVTLPQERWGEERLRVLKKYDDLFNLKSNNKDVFGQPINK